MYKSRIQNVKQRSKRDEKNRELELPDTCQEFAIVQEMLGNGRVRIIFEDKQSRIGRICGSMRKYKSKVLIESGDLVIISKRDYEKDKVDIIHKYALDEANKLTYEGYLPEYLYKVFTKDDKFNIGSNIEESTTTDYVFFAKKDNDEFNVEDI
jgi:translation initiation factor 1A